MDHSISYLKSIEASINTFIEIAKITQSFSSHLKSSIFIQISTGAGSSDLIVFLQAHQKRAKWQNKKFPNYLDLCVIFGKDRATGKDALSTAEIIELDEEIQTNDRDNGLTPTRSKEISSKSSTFKKRKRKSSFDIDSESAMVRAATILAVQLEKSSTQFANFLGLEASLNE